MKKIILLAISAIIIITCSSPQPSNLTLKFSPSESHVQSGNTFELAVNVENVSNLYACSMDISYDGSIIDYQTGSLYQGNGWNQEIFKFEHVKDNKLSVCVGLTASGSFPGEGELFTIKFLAGSSGETSVTIENVSIIQENGQPVSGLSSLEKRDCYVIIQ